MSGEANHSRILNSSENARSLDLVQLRKLEESFRDWAASPKRLDHLRSRQRILMIFLMIRYTGARLSEVLMMDPLRDMDFESNSVRFCKGNSRDCGQYREVQIPSSISDELKRFINELRQSRANDESTLNVDPGHVRRKFYERAKACGFSSELGAPEIIRKSRGVELLQQNVPIPVVQRILGHSTPNLTAAFVEFSEEEVRQVARHFAEKENHRTTSARNEFFGKVDRIAKGDVQTEIGILSVEGHQVTTVITTGSLSRLGINIGSLVTAEVKAPWVILGKGVADPDCTAENSFRGQVERISKGRISVEVVVRISDNTEICSIVTSKTVDRLALKEKDSVWVLFNAYAVVLHVD
ncbi:MAG: TOBE domain-containing protein [Desulfobacterales bacterium]